MNKIKEQLKNEDGSSLMIAIVILLICMVLGGIVISAASVNMTRLERSRREQQAYVTAESTALLFRDLMEGQKLLLEADASGQLQVKVDTKTGSEELGQMLAEDVSGLLGIGGTAKDQAERDLELSGGDALADQEVKVTYTMNSGYGIDLKIQVLREGKVLSQMTEEIPASLKTQDQKTAISWKQGTITRLKEKGKEET
ncbi:MAG: hypothetical protein UDG86_05130 [Lachnospiraceae bacterium]|jgi:hypothetical protein|nr:hypothetical protein [Lachnospiraceae bacterium]